MGEKQSAITEGHKYEQKKSKNSKFLTRIHSLQSINHCDDQKYCKTNFYKNHFFFTKY